MEYPFRPLPSELTVEIARIDPRVYRRLALTSRRVQSAINPALASLCRQPISAIEITNFYRESGYTSFRLDTPIRPWNPAEPVHILEKVVSVKIGTSELRIVFADFLTSNDVSSAFVTEERPLDTLTMTIQQLLDAGYVFNLVITNKILNRRLSCRRWDPAFATRITFEIFESRLRTDLDALRTYPSNSSAIANIVNIIKGLIQSMASILDVRDYDNYLGREFYILTDPTTKLDRLLTIVADLRTRVP